MHSIAKKSLAIASAVGVGGISSLLFGAAPASATTTCSHGGTLVSGNICEVTFTSNGTFTSTSSMTHLQVLLVGGGGDGGYSGGGGGGDVKVINFDHVTSGKFTVVVGSSDDASTVTKSKVTASANGGGDATNGNQTGSGPATPGDSGRGGSGTAGWDENGIAGGGGGAYDSPTSQDNGGAGLAPAAVGQTTIKDHGVGPSINLFGNDLSCYGGGGAVGDGTTNGIPGCNAAYVLSGGTISEATANHGGGGASVIATPTGSDLDFGADGVVVIRWNAKPTVKLEFNDGSHGHTPATIHLLSGDIPIQPANPVVKGYAFVGWYTNSTHTKPANFTLPVTKTETFYGKFTKG